MPTTRNGHMSRPPVSKVTIMTIQETHHDTEGSDIAMRDIKVDSLPYDGESGMDSQSTTKRYYSGHGSDEDIEAGRL